jgi:hypothetical protein
VLLNISSQIDTAKVVNFSSRPLGRGRAEPGRRDPRLLRESVRVFEVRHCGESHSIVGRLRWSNRAPNCRRGPPPIVAWPNMAKAFGGGSFEADFTHQRGTRRANRHTAGDPGCSGQPLPRARSDLSASPRAIGRIIQPQYIMSQLDTELPAHPWMTTTDPLDRAW